MTRRGYTGSKTDLRIFRPVPHTQAAIKKEIRSPNFAYNLKYNR